MPISAFGNSNSNDNGNKFDTTLFVQKPYLRTNYIESNIEEDVHLKDQYRVKNLPDHISMREAASKIYVDTLFNDSSMTKKTEHIDPNDRNITNARFIQVNQLPQIDSHLTVKFYVDNTSDESTLVRNTQDDDFNSSKITNINSITLNTQAENDNEVLTKAYVDQFLRKNDRSRRGLGIDLYDETNDFVKNNRDKIFNDNKLTNLDSITVNRNPNTDNELSNKKYIDVELDKNTIVIFNQTLEIYLKASIGNDTYNLRKNNKTQITDTTIMKAGNTGGYLFAYWRNTCNDKNNQAKISNFVKSTKTNSPSSNSGATNLPPIGDAFMYTETSSQNHGPNVFVSWERTDVIKIINITFYYNRFSTLTDDILVKVGRFRIQLLLDDDTWSTQCTIAKNSQYSDNSTDWTLLNSDFTVENCGITIILDQIDTAQSCMCISIITVTHSVF